MKLVTTALMRDLEQRTEALGLPSPALMENAGRAVADAIGDTFPVSGRSVLVLVGPGNNGGDGLVAARHLHDFGARVTCYLVRRLPNGRSASDVKLALLEDRGVPLHLVEHDPGLRLFDVLIRQSDLILDSLLGTGRSRPLTGPIQEILERVNARDQRRTPLVAVDLPTGLDADTGRVDPATPRADLTITLGRPKRGLFLPPGAELVGRVRVVDIGLAPGLDASPMEYPEALLEARAIRPLLPERPRLGHKGTFGKVMVVAGSARYTGAPALAAMGAYRAGAGLVCLAGPKSGQLALQSRLVEPTFLPLAEAPDGSLEMSAADQVVDVAADYDALLLGPGLGQSATTANFLRRLLDARDRLRHLRWLVDADGLNLLARIAEFWQFLPERTVLTPHPGEMARLLGTTLEEDRLRIATRAAAQWRQVVVLKGAYTVVAAPDAITQVSPFANPALSTAGTGDVLAGVIAGLLAQGLAPDDAAMAGVYVHGVAGALLSERYGASGGLAGDLLNLVPEAVKRLRDGARFA